MLGERVWLCAIVTSKCINQMRIGNSPCFKCVYVCRHVFVHGWGESSKGVKKRERSDQSLFMTYENPAFTL